MRSNKLSQSAAFIAIKFFGLTRKAEFRDLFDGHTVRFYEKVVQSLPFPLKYYHHWLRFRPVRSFYIAAEELFLPGDLMHILARKWYMEQMVDELVDRGYGQILVLGAGFDHLGLRYAGRGIPSLELDTPRMAQLKRQLLEQHYPGKPQPDILPLTLPDHSLSDLLQQHMPNPGKKTIIIAEGFFDYLEKKVVTELLSTLRRHFASPVLVSTHFALNELSSFHRFIFRSSLRIVGEKPEFGVSMKTFRALLQNSGFRIQKEYGPDAISENLLSSVNTDLPMLRGFYLFSAR
ncbi:Leucine carboxyl methyltransferase [Fodinibius roseus]|uniref:Leucine carboxyl methyltransferase n=1 Tax=Fodinibius roseus TaxID=1194090 RepID=A0A1M5BHW5_9BACT|nr:class I SAM-dependent methyltransferase [Fodinibius roseus]SHF41930.1 Leucine carboxyl methyltransferase [Fodinibius roseus]